MQIIDIAAGAWHSAALSAFADVYLWGFNTNGQLGLRVFKQNSSHLKEPSVYPLPQLPEIPKCSCICSSDAECEPLQIACGARHTFIKMNCGTLMACGWNLYGQLGDYKDSDFMDKFSKIKTDAKDYDIVCSAWNTVLIKRPI